MSASFLQNVKPLFQESDINCTKAEGMDLSSYDDVKKHAEEIHAEMKSGNTPLGDAPWPGDQVSLFEKWINESTSACV